VKIAFMHHTFIEGSGIDSVTYQLAKRLNTEHEVTVISFNNEYDNSGIPTIEYKVPFGKVYGAVFSPFFAREVRQDLKQFDVVITQLYPCNIISLLPTKLRVKTIFIEWGLQPSYAFSGLLDRAYIKLLEVAHGYAIRHSDLVITANSETTQFIKSKYSITPHKLNLYGVDFNYLNKDVGYSSLLEKYPQLKNKKTILYLGRITPHKNQHLLIEALEITQKTIPNTVLVLVGRASSEQYREQLKKLIKHRHLQDTVIMTGLVSREDVPRWYALCDIFVYASSWEGYMNPEPLAMGKPIVGYNAIPHRETVQHNVNGLLVNELTPEAFAQAQVMLLSDDELRHTMGVAGYKWAKENLDYDKIVEHFSNLIGGQLKKG